MKAIEVQPLADVDGDILEGLPAALQDTFGVPVSINNDSMPIEQFYDWQRGQYNSTAILRYLDRPSPSIHRTPPPHVHDGVRIIGVTGRDLFIPILTYVFGEAALGGSVAVVSYHRFRNELFGLQSDPVLVRQRLQKVAIHELGHSLGLVHCSLQYCVMHSASYVEELDLKGSRFCPFCQSAVGKETHPLTRYNDSVSHLRR